MLKKAYTPRDIPSRFVACLECGAEVEVKTNPLKCCAACALERKRRRARLTAERKRRERGVPVVKGVLVPCRLCGTTFTRVGRKATCCLSCRPKAALARRYERWAEKPALALNSRVSNAIGPSLKGNKAGRSWESLVGYTLDDLARHLERQFTKNMTWQRLFDGEIHVDHILPLASFNFDTAEHPEFKAAWALTNLRPMWATENKSKYAKRLYLL